MSINVEGRVGSVVRADSLTVGSTYVGYYDGSHYPFTVVTATEWGCDGGGCHLVHANMPLDNGEVRQIAWDTTDEVTVWDHDAYIPAVGDWVTMTSWLSDTGEVITGERDGLVLEVSDTVYAVQTNRTSLVLTGPGCVTRSENRDAGMRVRVTYRGSALPAVGTEGIIFGEDQGGVLVTFPREERQFGSVYPGSWWYEPSSIAPVEMVTVTNTDQPRTPQVGDRVEAFEPNIAFNGAPWFGTVQMIQLDHPNAKYRVNLDSGETIWFNRVVVVPQVPRRSPQVGDRIVATRVPGVNGFDGAVGTIVRVYEPRRDGNGHNVVATFEQDGTTYEFSLHLWEYAPEEEEPITFETKERMIGKRIRVIRASGLPQYVGVEGIVTDVYPTRETAAQPKVDGITVRIAETGRVWVQAYEVLPDEPVAEPEPEVRPSQETGIITDLQAEAERLRQRINVLERWQENAREDWDLINALVNQEATDRQWCGDYERVFRRVESRLKVLEWQPREREISITVTVRGTLETTRTITVTARDEDHARELVDDDWEQYVDNPDGILTEAARSVSFEDISVSTVNDD